MAIPTVLGVVATDGLRHFRPGPKQREPGTSVWRRPPVVQWSEPRWLCAARFLHDSSSDGGVEGAAYLVVDPANRCRHPRRVRPEHERGAPSDSDLGACSRPTSRGSTFDRKLFPVMPAE
jgi:hypothetical protein